MREMGRVGKVYTLVRDGVGRYVRSAKSAQSARIEWRVWYVTMRDRRRRSKERTEGRQSEGWVSQRGERVVVVVVVVGG